MEGLRKSSSSDVAYGIRVVIGGSSEDWFGSSAGGVAYLDSFSWETDEPAFVFQMSASAVWEATSHEVRRLACGYNDPVIPPHLNPFPSTTPGTTTEHLPFTPYLTGWSYPLFGARLLHHRRLLRRRQ